MAMKYISILILLLLITSSSLAQGKRKTFSDCLGLKRYYVSKGDTVIFKCDNILLLNQRSFKMMDSSYVNLRELSTSLVSKTDSASLIYKRLYDDKSKQYDQLFDDYSKFRESTSGYINSISADLTKVNGNLIDTKAELKSANDAIAKAVGNIQDSQNKQFMTKLKWGGIGFALAATVFLLSK
jgi:methyl-accepting chemotaxis protein